MRVLRNLQGALGLFGFDVGRLANACLSLGWFFSGWKQFYAQERLINDKSFSRGRLLPCLADRHEQGGVARGQYFHQDLLVARLIYRDNPKRHVDIGSRVDGFVAHVAAFRPIEVFDVRPIKSNAANIVFRQLDIMDCAASPSNCTDSLSCLHALEHFGLGRYGDKIDFNGHRRGLTNVTRMLVAGGKFYFSVPITERQRIEFNAHRIFSIPYLLDLFDEHELEVTGFHYVDDIGELHEQQGWLSPPARRTFDLHHGCGIFELLKRET
jgi:hypothetical protein